MNITSEKNLTFFVILGITLLAMLLVANVGGLKIIGIYTTYLLLLPFYFNVRQMENREEILKPQFLNLFAFIIIFGVAGLNHYIVDPEKNRNILFMILLAYIALNSGIHWGEAIDLRKSAKANSRWNGKRATLLLDVWLAVLFFATFIYFAKMGSIPWFSEQPEQARVTLAEKGGGYLRVIIYSGIVWIMLAYTSMIKKIYRRSRLFFVVVAILMLVFLALGNRAPLVTIVCMLMLIKLGYTDLLIKTGRKYLLLAFAVAVLIVLAFGLTGTMRVVQDKKVSQYTEYKELLKEKEYATIFFSQIFSYLAHGVNNFATVYENVPEKYDYKFGATYFYPALTVLPGKQYTLDMQLKHAFNMKFSGGGLVPSTLGEAYVNFGKAGVVFVPFLIGFVLSMLYKKFKLDKCSGYGLVYLFLLYYLSIHMVSGILASSVFLMEAIVLILVFDKIVTIKRDETE